MKLLILIALLHVTLYEVNAQVRLSTPMQDIAWATASIISNSNHRKQEISFTSEIEEYNVVLKDSSQMKVLSKIYLDSTGHTYLIYSTNASPNSNLLIDKKLYCYNTISITRLESKRKASIEGKATDSCWLFQVIEGKINIYSLIPDLNYNSFYFRAMRIDDGAIEPLNERKLRILMKGNLRALNALDKRDYYKAVYRYNRS